MDWLIDILRIFFFFLDSIIYPLISLVYNLLMDIANTTIFTEDIIDFFASKVYALLGIFMLFKVSFSILTYIVNPDDFTDNKKGFGKIISNTVLTFVLLLITPWIFSQAMDIQKIILKDNILGKIFSVSSVSNISTLDAGDTMAYETFTSFYYLDLEATGASVCEGFKENTIQSAYLTKCQDYLGDRFTDFQNVLQISYVTKNVSFYMNYDLLNERNSNNEYIMSYMPVISTIAGGFICWILFVFCFDVAVRSIKLGFLRMIAPVPIVSRIDPKKGNEVFNKWVGMCFSTYIDLFGRLLAIYFAVFVISVVCQGDFVDAATGLPVDVDIFVKVFIIMGALLFAKQLPKLVADITGIKLSGNFTMNPLKKMGEVPLAGNLAARGLGAVGSKMAGQGFKAGWRAGGKAVPLLGGDGKQSIAAGFNRFNRFGDDGKKRAEEHQKYKLGEDLFDKYGEKASGNAAIYKGANASRYAESAGLVNAAKDRRNELESAHKQLEMFFDANKEHMSAEQQADFIKRIDKARIDAVKASSDYDKLKTAHNYLRSQDAVNAAREDAYLAAEDRHSAAAKVGGYSGSQIDFEALAAGIENENNVRNMTDSTTIPTYTQNYSSSSSSSANTSVGSVNSTGNSTSTGSANSTSSSTSVNSQPEIHTPGLNPEDRHNSEW